MQWTLINSLLSGRRLLQSPCLIPRWLGNETLAVHCLVQVASFPGSHTRERKHWSCVGVESLVLFLTWEVVKDRREVDATLIVCGCMRLRTEKGTKVANNLLHVSSYWASNIIHTERWSIVGWITRKTLPFCFSPILITSCLRRKDTRLSMRSGRAWEWGYGTRLLQSLCLIPRWHSLIALIIPVQPSCCERSAFWSQPSSNYICLKRFTLWSWGKDSATKKHLANIQHSQAQILADLVLWPHFITNTCSVYCTLQIGCHRETDSFTRSINHHWDFINQPQDEDYLFPCGQPTPGSVVLRRQQFSRNYHYHQGFLPTMRVHNMPYN